MEPLRGLTRLDWECVTQRKPLIEAVEKQPGRLFVVSWLLFIPLIVLCFLPFVYLVAADSPSAWVFMLLWWVPLLPLAVLAYGLPRLRRSR